MKTKTVATDEREKKKTVYMYNKEWGIGVECEPIQTKTKLNRADPKQWQSTVKLLIKSYIHLANFPADKPKSMHNANQECWVITGDGHEIWWRDDDVDNTKSLVIPLAWAQ